MTQIPIVLFAIESSRANDLISERVRSRIKIDAAPDGRILTIQLSLRRVPTTALGRFGYIPSGERHRCPQQAWPANG